MKYLIPLIIASMFTLGALPTQAQTKGSKNLTEEIEVSGVCGMCKRRIEKAALIKGVRVAEWDKENQLLKVTFHATKTSSEAIQRAVAAAGYDTALFKGNDQAYGELPGCCQYRSGIEVH